MKWASTQTGRTVALPSEAQWEYAARGPMNWKYPWGNAWDGRKANHADKSLKNSGMGEATWDYSEDFDGTIFTSPVGYYANASWCGAFDMSGNVWNWCRDTYDEKFYSKTGGIDPINIAPGAAKLLRGGSWYRTSPRDCQASIWA